MMLLAAESSASLALLPALIIVPLVTALVIALLPASRSEYLKLTALFGSSIAGALSVYLLKAFDEADGGLQFVVREDWVQSLGLSWFFAVDGISLFLVVLTGLLFPIAILAAEPHHDPKAYYLWLMVLMAGSFGVFMALDLLLFFLFFEIVLVPMYFLIGGWGHGRRIYAALKFFLYTMAGSALMLVGIVALAVLTARSTGQRITFDVTVLAEAQALSTNAQRLVFLAFALAFAVKVPLFPLHTWLPDAHTEAPTAGSVILAGVMLKLGTYGYIRFGVYLFPQVAKELAPLFLTLAVIGIVYGAIAATMQTDLKRLVAYSSVAHMGFIVLGIFVLNTQGMEGAILQMVNHGLSTGALFIMVGWIYERRHTREIAELGGLQKSAPIFAAGFTWIMLSSIGLPGLNGFVGEFLILLGGFEGARWWTVVAVSGVILAALYLLWAYQRVFHGPADGPNVGFPELRFSEGLVLLPLLALIVFLGIYPKPVLERIEPAVDRLLVHVEDNVDGFERPEPDAPTQRAGVEQLTNALESGSHESGESDESGESHEGED
ncbi:MAG: NADH-quinone oxidoreductase subunit M [Actinomycetota bacterium]|nr:NADH-quinone oxidoreductase subunit M [Actinomycetota bacterium]